MTFPASRRQSPPHSARRPAAIGGWASRMAAVRSTISSCLVVRISRLRIFSPAGTKRIKKPSPPNPRHDENRYFFPCPYIIRHQQGGSFLSGRSGEAARPRRGLCRYSPAICLAAWSEALFPYAFGNSPAICSSMVPFAKARSKLPFRHGQGFGDKGAGGVNLPSLASPPVGFPCLLPWREVQGIVNNLESQAEIQAKIVGGPNLAGRGIGPQGAPRRQDSPSRQAVLP